MKWYDVCLIVFFAMKIIQWIAAAIIYFNMSDIERMLLRFKLGYSDLALIFIPTYLILKD